MINLKPTEFSSFYKPYVDAAKHYSSIFDALIETKHLTVDYFLNLNPSKHDYRYLSDKWSPKEILQHIIDTERVFAYRALRISRNDTTLLPGYDENLFAKEANVNNRTMIDLVNEFKVVRESTLLLFNSVDRDALNRVGTASDNKVSVRALAVLIAGHSLHHIKIISERYL